MSRRKPTLARATLLLGAVASIGAVPTAEAQAPPLCQAAPADFTKTVRNLNGGNVYNQGDTVEYLVSLCNPGPGVCASTAIQDYWDNLNGQRGIPTEDLNVVPMPPTVGCPTDGGALCEKGLRGSNPSTWTPVPNTRCGLDCNLLPQEPLRMNPNVNDPAGQLQPGECYFHRFRAVIGTNIQQTECLCNQAVSLRCTTPGNPACLAGSNDPSFRPGQFPDGLGCADTDICQSPGICATCFRIFVAPPNLNPPNSMKCIDSAPPPCLEDTTKAQGQPISYYFTVRNTGGQTANDVSVYDLLAFSSSLGTPCLDLTRVTVSPVTCTGFTPAGGCTPPDYQATYGAGEVNGYFLAIPAGGSVSFRVDTFVHANANGVCRNVWELSYVEDLMPVEVGGLNAPTFTVTAPTPDLGIEKTLSSGQSPNPLPGTNVSFDIVVRNVGSGAISGLTIQDVLQASPCFDPLGMVGRNCQAARVDCVSGNCGACAYTASGFDLTGVNLAPNDGAPGGPDEFVVRVTATLTATASGTCTNTAQGQDGAAIEQSSASVVVASATPDLVLAKDLGPGQPSTVSVGAGVAFAITVENLGGSAITNVIVDDVVESPCFAALGPSGQPCGANVACTGAACAGATCTYTGTGFTYTGLDLAASDGTAGSGPDFVSFAVTAVAAQADAACVNTASTSDPDPAVESDQAQVTVLAAPGVVVRKTVAPSSVTVGGSAQYTIVVDNTAGSGPLVNCVITDSVSATGCMTLASCDSSTPVITVNCNPPSGFTTAPFNVAAGATQTVVITVAAGAVENPGCINRVDVTCQSGSAFDEEPLVITPTAACALMRGDATFPPTSPARAGDWLYTGNECAPRTLTIPPTPATQKRLAVTHLAAPSPPADIDAVAGAPGSLRLYQYDCPCVTGVHLVKNPADRTQIRLSTF